MPGPCVSRLAPARSGSLRLHARGRAGRAEPVAHGARPGHPRHRRTGEKLRTRPRRRRPRHGTIAETTITARFANPGDQILEGDLPPRHAGGIGRHRLRARRRRTDDRRVLDDRAKRAWPMRRASPAHRSRPRRGRPLEPLRTRVPDLPAQRADDPPHLHTPLDRAPAMSCRSARRRRSALSP